MRKVTSEVSKYKYSFHILLQFGSRTVNQLHVCSAKFSKGLETMGMEQRREKRKEVGRERL